MNKRGQITVFILLGLTILISVGILYSVTRDKGTIPINVPSIENVNLFVSQCSKQTFDTGIVRMGLNTGHIYPLGFPELANIGDENVAFLYYEGDKLIPKNEFFESQLSTYHEEFILNCLDFSDFKDLDIKINDIVSTVTIDNGIELKSNVGLEIKSGESVTNTVVSDTFSSDVRFTETMSLAEKIVDASISNKGFMSLNVLVEIADKGFLIDIFPITPQTMGIQLIDETDDFLFQFGYKP